MSDRVLSTDAARSAVRQMQQIIDGPLAEQIDFLNRQGEILCDPNLWDGNQARQFRQEWPTHLQNLRRTQESLNQLRGSVERAISSILQAGGI